MYEIFLGIRYLKAKRKQAFISIISVISVLGVMMGVMALVVVLSVMNGFRADWMSKILGVNPHIIVTKFEGAFDDYEKAREIVDKIDGVVASTPFVYAQVMVKNAGNASGPILRGIDPASVGQVLKIGDMIKGGSLSSLINNVDGLPPIIIGSELSKQMGAYSGDILTVVTPEGKLTPLGRAPSTRMYRVVGLLDSGMYEYDASMVYVSLKEAQGLMGMGDRVTGLGIRVQDIYSSDKTANLIEEDLGGPPFWTRDWKMMNRSLFSALKLEKITMFVILTMIVLVGALNIISTLVMVVMEKTRDVAILRAMGATTKSIMSIFMLQGLLVGLTGTLAGLAAGWGLCQILEKYKFIDLPADIYSMSRLPVMVQSWDLFFVTLAAVGISFLATLYPSWYASRLNPVEALRYE